MKLKTLVIGGSGLFLMVFSLLLFVAILFSDEQDSGISNIHYGGVNVSAEVLAHKPMVEKYAKEYGVEEYVNILLAIIQVESGGTAEDVMQSSESLGLPPNSLSTEESIKQGVKYFSELLASSERLSVDLESVIQSYNYGGGFLGYVANRGNKYTFELAQSFSKEYSGGEKVSYPNPIAIPINGGWRYNYGNMFYVQLVTQYLVTTEFDDDTVQAIMDEALKYEGWRYVYGGASPTTSFDCSGLTQWTYGKAGINLPRTAQQQYDVTQHIPLSEAQAGDLVFFHSTYNAGSYITHVGIYLGNNRMFHAGDPIGYADLTSPYWQQHFSGSRTNQTMRKEDLMMKFRKNQNKEKQIPKEKKPRVYKVNPHKKVVIALWVLLGLSFSFAIFKHFTAIDTHTIHETTIIEKEYVDTHHVENFVENFAKVYYSWEQSDKSIDNRMESLKGYLTDELQALNVDTVRKDIPVSSSVRGFQIWTVEPTGDNEFNVTYSVDQLITEGENTKTVHSAYIVSVYVDGSGNMVLVKNPTITNIPKKSSYKPKAIESEGTVDSITTNEINEFLTTFFKLYPTATASELSYYVNDGILKPIGKEYIFQELVNPIHNRKDNQVTVSLTVEYIDQQTKATQVSQFDLVLEKNGSNWKIIE